MDPRLLRYYNQELSHLREMGAEFARQFPKIAARLGMDGIEVADPYVERLLEGAGFLSARIQLRLDAEFPRFTQRLLEMVYPHYLAPTPSMLIAQFNPVPGDSNLAKGAVVPRGTPFRNAQSKGDAVACEFRTAHDIRLWPLEIAQARYFSVAPDLPLSRLNLPARVKGGLRLRLRCTGGAQFRQLSLDTLQLHLAGAHEIAFKLYELIGASLLGALVLPVGETPASWHEFLPAAKVRLTGFSDEQALLPTKRRGFAGYRLMQEYFSFPERFMFVDIDGLQPIIARQASNELEIVLLFGQGETMLESVVDASNLLLHCTPAINLFPKRLDRIHVTDASHEFHAVPDRTHPLDYEIYEFSEVVGHSGGARSEQSFLPFYADYHSDAPGDQAYFMARREPRLPSEKQKRIGTRTGYIGSEVFLSLVDPREAPYSADLRQLSLQALCTNRDLPILMPLGSGKTDFTLDVAAPVDSVRCVKGPSRPYSMLAEGSVAWRLISQLSLNYLSLLDSDPQEGAAALRQMLELYASTGDAGLKRQIEGLKSVTSAPVVRRLPMAGPICFGRGLEITLEVDEMAFEGGGAFLFGQVLSQFFARHASMNSFTQTVLRSQARGQIMRWAPQCGLRPIL
ncbi:type VI secretion system baseplate subunit TssF [Uliginosibacterium sp. 31-16]|uniref:type VI secretion system baseplate subunit TssF n=1 Tax=Uliginosibacterium sp. 31-16 TaxID=3068315 RepID=UPI00273FED86|nr:type VI secretion system baseplate subunit TssF [Uliginosibacterium sp. 31-16]MDP5240059.1 type VI secretion system baseplate subunit TssF [Uliginosibacterium sp. 31-16]